MEASVERTREVVDAYDGLIVTMRACWRKDDIVASQVVGSGRGADRPRPATVAVGASDAVALRGSSSWPGSLVAPGRI